MRLFFNSLTLNNTIAMNAFTANSRYLTNSIHITKTKKSFLVIVLSIFLNNAFGAIIYSEGVAVPLCPMQQKSIQFTISEEDIADFPEETSFSYKIELNNATDFEIINDIDISPSNPKDVTLGVVSYTNVNAPSFTVTAGGVANKDVVTITVNVRRKTSGALTVPNSTLVLTDNGGSVVSTFTLTAVNPVLSYNVSNYCTDESPEVTITVDGQNECNAQSNATYKLIKINSEGFRKEIPISVSPNTATASELDDFIYSNFKTDNTNATGEFIKKGLKYTIYKFADQDYSPSSDNLFNDFSASQSGYCNTFEITNLANIYNGFYGIEFSGFLKINSANTYRFYATNVDDWVKFYVDNLTSPLIEATWSNNVNGSDTDTKNLTTGDVDVKLRYFQGIEGATFTMEYSAGDNNSGNEWDRNNNYIARKSIPVDNLYCTVNDDGTGEYSYKIKVEYDFGYSLEEDLVIPESINPTINNTTSGGVCYGDAMNITFTINNDQCITTDKKAFISKNGSTAEEVTLNGSTYTLNQTITEGDEFEIIVSYNYDGDGNYLEEGVDGNFSEIINATTIANRSISLNLETPTDPVCYGTPLDLEIIPVGCTPSSLTISYNDGTTIVSEQAWSSFDDNTAGTGKIYNHAFVPGKTIKVDAIYNEGSNESNTIEITPADRFMIPSVQAFNASSICPDQSLTFSLTMQNECLSAITTREVFIEENSVVGGSPLNQANDGSYTHAFHFNKTYKIIIKYYVNNILVPQTLVYTIDDIQDYFNSFGLTVTSPQTPTCYGQNLEFTVQPISNCLPSHVRVNFTTGDNSKNIDQEWNYGNNPHTISIPAELNDVFQIVADYQYANSVTIGTVTIDDNTFPSFFDTVGITMKGVQPTGVSYCPSEPVEVLIKQKLTRACDLDRIELIGINKDDIEQSLGIYDDISGDTVTLNFDLTTKDFKLLYSKGFQEISPGVYRQLCASDKVSIGESFTFQYDVNIVPTLPVDVDIENNTIYSSIYGSLMNLTEELNIDYYVKTLNFYYSNDYEPEAPSLYYSITSLNPELFDVFETNISSTYNFSGKKFTLLPKKSGSGQIEIRRLTPNSNCYDVKIVDVDITPDIIDAEPIYCVGYDEIDTVQVATDWLGDDDIKPTQTIFKKLLISTDGESYYEPEKISQTDKFTSYLITPTQYFNDFPTDIPDSLESISIRFRLVVDIKTAILELNDPDSVYDYGTVQKVEITPQTTTNPITNEEETTYVAEFSYKTSQSSTIWNSISESYYSTKSEAKSAYEKYMDEEFYKQETSTYSLGSTYYYRFRHEEQTPTNNPDGSSIYYYKKIRNRYTVKEVISIEKSLDRSTSDIFKPISNAELLNDIGPYCYGQNPIQIYGTLLTIEIEGSDAVTYDNQTGNWYYNPTDEIFDTITEPYNDTIIYHFQDKNTCASSKEYQIIVNPSPIDTIFASYFCKGDSTSFVARKDISDNTTTELWEWNFGNGFTASSVDTNSILYEYENAGQYTVHLKTTNQYLCESNDELDIIIEDYPTIDFHVDNHLAGVDNLIINESKLKNASYENVDTVIWTIVAPDGAKSTFGRYLTNVEKDSIAEEIPYIFEEPGVYSINLEVITENQCSADSTLPFPVFEIISLDDENNYPNPSTSDFGDWLVSSDYTSFNKGKATWQYKAIETSSVFDQGEHGAGDAMWHIDNKRDQQVWIESPCFDLRELPSPMIKFDIYHSVETGFDGAVVQYLINDSTEWKVLGELDGKGIYWYNMSGTVSDPGTTGNGINEAGVSWSKNDSVWYTVAYPIDSIADKLDPDFLNISCVQFRIAFGSNSSNPATEFDGFAVSDLAIAKRDKVVLLEQFVNDQIPGSKAEEQFITNNYNSDEYCIIRYHMEYNFLQDDVYNLNAVDVSARAQEYGTSATGISTIVDGIETYKPNISSQSGALESFATNRNLLMPVYTISPVDFSSSGENILFDVTIEKQKNVHSDIYDNYETFVRMAIVLPHYKINDTIYNDVLVELLPQGPGNHVYTFHSTDSPNIPVNIQGSWSPVGYDLKKDSLKLVVYVQDMVGENEVHQVHQELIPSDIPVFIPEINNSVEESIMLYPNPAENIINIATKNINKELSWKLFSTTGALLKNGIISKNELNTPINIHTLTNGTYYIEILHKDEFVERLQFIKL